MNSPESQIIVRRFFSALRLLIAAGCLRGLQTFARRYGANRWNMLTEERAPERDMFQPAWLSVLVLDFHVSARWLLTGEGEMFEAGWSAARVREKGGKP